MSQELLKICQSVLSVINGFFVVYLIGYSTFLFLSIIVGADTLYRKRREIILNNVSTEDYYIPISIIVPAYNEEITVVETVRSLLALDYKLYEIIVVNDGSKDKTEQVMIDAFNLQKVHRPIRFQVPCQPVDAVYETLSERVHITLISKKNGGKADALNMGVNAAAFPYFICMDADSMLQYDSLREIARPILENGNVVAVGGAVRPSNGCKMARGRVTEYHLPRNILACMQTLEYDRSFLAARILLDKFNGSMIISGAFGLFKKDIVVGAGGYDASTMGEDMELVVKMHEYCVNNDVPYAIKYATNAICWSQAPENLGDLCKQRRRWHRGLYQCMAAHKRMLGNRKYAPVSIISFPYFLIYELFSPVIEIIGLLSIALAYVSNILNFKFMFIFFGVYALFGTVMTLSSFFSRVQTIDLKVSFADSIKAVGLCLFEITFLRFILATVRMRALFGMKKKKNLQWGSIQRKKLDYK